MALYSGCVYRYNFVECVEGNVAILGLNFRDWTILMNQTYRILLSRLDKNFPRILIAITLKPVSASISSTVNTVSYNIEFPTFFVESVLVATCFK